MIVVDRSGTILEFNAYERRRAGFGEKAIVGLNFFRDVAPCTAVREFEGRFDTFLDSADTSIEPFRFVFPFRHGPQPVFVLFVRTTTATERATICVHRDEGVA